MMLVLEEKVGPVRCGVFLKDPRSGHAIFDVPLKPEAVGAPLDREAFAMALGLLPAEIGFENHEPSAFTCGTPYVFIPVRGLDAIAKARPNPGAWDKAFRRDANAAYLYCRETVGKANAFHARMFAPQIGIAEDPATGGAAAAFTGVVHRFDRLPSGTHRRSIEQGFEMGRPSIMRLEIDVEQGAIAAARVGGDAVVIAEGGLTV
jgi:trans-2,3-dihydro-3-hydroxyanthranilate isomerase